MELFKTKELKNEFEEMKKLLPLIVVCNYCQKKSCIYHPKFIISCTLCRNARCKNCVSFDISKSILLKSSSQETKTYLENFICDFLNISTESFQIFFPEIRIEKKEKINYSTRVKSEKNRFQVVKTELDPSLRRTQFQHGKYKRKVFY